MDVYCLKAGDSIECGCGLVSIHATYEGALLAANKMVEEQNSHWKGEDDYLDWEYVEDNSACGFNIVGYWKQRNKGYDIIMITKDPVLEIA